MTRTKANKEQTCENLLNEQYIENRGEIIKQYELYVEMADRISNRRSKTNTFYLTANSILLVAFGPIIDYQLFSFLVLASFIGLIMSLLWYQQIKHYKNLNRAKFMVINKIEDCLPVKGFTTEWELLQQGKNRKIYWPLSHIEILLPAVLVMIYLLLFLSTAWFLLQ